VTKGGRPGPIRTANRQIRGVVVEKRARIAGITRWIPRSVKGWAVMSRWGVDKPARDAFQFVLDPNTEGEPLSDEDRREIERDVARTQVRQILESLGYEDLASDTPRLGAPLSVVPRQGVGIELHGEANRTFLGTVASPFGILPFSIIEARDAASSLPTVIASRFWFVGLDTEMILRMRSQGDMEPRPTRLELDGTTIGPDGLLLAPLNRVVPKVIEIFKNLVNRSSRGRLGIIGQ
jgi:hypothetical protein